MPFSVPKPQWQVHFQSPSVAGHPQWPKTPLAYSTVSSALLATHSGKYLSGLFWVKKCNAQCFS